MYNNTSSSNALNNFQQQSMQTSNNANKHVVQQYPQFPGYSPQAVALTDYNRILPNMYPFPLGLTPRAQQMPYVPLLPNNGPINPNIAQCAANRSNFNQDNTRNYQTVHSYNKNAPATTVNTQGNFKSNRNENLERHVNANFNNFGNSSFSDVAGASNWQNVSAATNFNTRNELDSSFNISAMKNNAGSLARQDHYSNNETLNSSFAVNKGYYSNTTTRDSRNNVNAKFDPKPCNSELVPKNNPNVSGKLSNTDDNKTKAIKKTENEKTRILTGNAERVIKWYRIYKGHFCLYEVIAPVVAIQEGTIPLQKRMLLRDKKGPIIQIVHYINDHIQIKDFCIGKILRCVGRMIGPNMLHAYSIREAQPDEVLALQRMFYICDHAISRAIDHAT